MWSTNIIVLGCVVVQRLRDERAKESRCFPRWIPHVGVMNRRSWIHAEVGVYKAKVFLLPLLPGADPRRCRIAVWYSYEVRNAVANAVIRDRMPYRLVMQRMAEDYRLALSVGYVHDCFVWAHAQIDMEAHWAFVRATFSGVLCVDEVHDSGKVILLASDPLNDVTVSFERVESNDQAHMNAFLQRAQRPRT